MSGSIGWLVFHENVARSVVADRGPVVTRLCDFADDYRRLYQQQSDQQAVVQGFRQLQRDCRRDLARLGLGTGQAWPSVALRNYLAPTGWVVECGTLSVGATRLPLVWIGRLMNRVSGTLTRFDRATRLYEIYQTTIVSATPPLDGIRAWTGGQTVYLFATAQPGDLEHELQHVADAELVELSTADHLSELGFRRLQAFVEARAALQSIVSGPRPIATLTDLRQHWPRSADYRPALPLLEAALNSSPADHLSDDALRQRAAVGLTILDRDYPRIVSASNSPDPLSTALTQGR